MPEQLRNGLIEQKLVRWLLFTVVTGTALIASINVNDSTILKPPLLIVGSAAIVSVLLASVFHRQNMRLSLSVIDIFFLLYLLVSALSLIKATNMRLGLESLSQLVCYFVILTAGENFLGDENSRAHMIRCFLIVTGISCVVAMTQIYQLFPAIAILGANDRQAVSTFGNVTYFAGYLVLIIPVLVGEVLSVNKSFRYRIVTVVILLLALYLLIATEARSAWAGLIVAMLFFGFFYTNSRKVRFAAVGAVLITVVIAIVLFPDIFHKRFIGIFEMNPASSVTRRLFFYEGALNAFLSSPVIGNGIGNFIVFLPKFRSPEYWMYRSENIVPHAHNELLEILAETGFAGIVVFIMMVILFFVFIKKGWNNQTGYSRTLLSGLSCGIAAVIIDNMGSMNLRTVPVAVGFWTFIGMALCLKRVHSYSIQISLPPFTKKLRFLPYLLFAVFLGWYIPFVAARYTADADFLEGSLLNLHNNHLAASAKFRESLSHDVHNRLSRFYLSANLLKENNYDETRINIRKLLDEYPYYPKAALMLALCSLELGDTTTATVELAKEMALNTDPQTLYFASYVAFRLNRKEEEFRFIIILLNNSIKSSMNDFATEVISRLPEVCPKDSFPQTCAPLLTQLLDKFHSDLPIIIAAGECFEKFGFISEAKSAVQLGRSIQIPDPALKQQLEILANRLDQLEKINK